MNRTHKVRCVLLTVSVLLLAGSAYAQQEESEAPMTEPGRTTKTRTELLNELNLRSALVDLKNAKEAYDRFESEYRDAERLINKHIIAQKDLDDAWSRYNQAEQAGTKTEQMTNQLAHIVGVAKSGGNVYSEIQNNPSSVVARDRALTDMGKLLSGQPIGDFYAVAREQINKAAGKEIIKSDVDLLSAIYRSYEPNSFDAKQIEQAVRLRDQLPAARARIGKTHKGGERALSGSEH